MRPRNSTLLLLCLLLASPSTASADDVGAAPPAEDSVPRELTGREIYDRVLQNRFESYVQESHLISGDRGDESQKSTLTMTWQSFRELSSERTLSKTLVKYSAPFDLRFSGYLIINNNQRSNDQFVYLAASRRVRRVNLRAEAIFGTDFTFEDVVPREIEDGEYRRLPDELVGEVPCYVVEVTPKDHADSEYSKILVYPDKRHFVPLRTRYWDHKDLEIKELSAPNERVEDFGDVYVPMLLTMRNLQLDTYTELTVKTLEPNPKLHRRTFDLRRLEAH